MKHYQKLLVLTLLCSLTPLLTLAQKNTYNFKQAVAALNNQDIAKAKKLIFMDMGGNTKDPYDLFLLSLAYSIEKNVDSAFISIDQAIKYMPKSDETYLYQAYNYRAKLCETCNDSEKQLATYNDMVKALPKNVEALLLRAKFYANELEDYKHSKADLQKALQLDAGNLDAMYTLGDLEFVQKNCDKAIDCYTKVLTANPNYVESGQGMGATITMADEMQGYCLTDRGTWLKYKNDADLAIDLNIVCEGDANLLNQYGVIAVNPEKYEDTNIEGANAFIEWICSDEVQKLIGEYGVDTYGQALFTPNAE